VVERHHRPPVALFVDEAFASGVRVALEGDPARHARARRMATGDVVRLMDGKGRVGVGRIELLARNELTVFVEAVVEVPRPLPLEVIVPVADRDRMLMAAEKCVELQVTSWRPAYFARSRSVSPRGEGERFRDKVLARMRSALEQSGNAWLPDAHSEGEWSDVFRAVPTDGNRFLLDAGGVPLPELVRSTPTALAVGPEGGMEPSEITGARDAGWRLASLGTTTLRFETAILAGAAVVRATQLTRGNS